MLVNKFNIHQMVRIIESNWIRLGVTKQITIDTDKQGKYRLMYRIEDGDLVFNRPEDEIYATTEEARVNGLGEKVS